MHGDKWPDAFEYTNTGSDFFNYLYVLLPGKVSVYVKSKGRLILSLMYFDISYIYVNCTGKLIRGYTITLYETMAVVTV